MNGVFGQQPGLRPEPRLDATSALFTLRPEPRLAEQGAPTASRCGVGTAEGARGKHPPVDVGRRRGA